MRISVALPATGFVRPSDAELASLLAIVATAHPREGAKIDAAEFSRAFIAAGYMFRTASPRSDMYFSHFVDAASRMLRERWGAETVTAPAVFLACRAHNDIPWRKADPRAGQLLEVGLDEFHGLPCSNSWRAVLKGDNLFSPTAPDPTRPREPERGPVRYYRLNPGGALRLMADDEGIW